MKTTVYPSRPGGFPPASFLTFGDALAYVRRLSDLGDGLAFNLPRGAKNKANKVCIRLAGDLYRVAFYSVRGVTVTERGEFDMIYGDRLAALFTEQTGFDTHL